MRRALPLALLLPAGLGLLGCRGGENRPGWVVLPGMVESVPYDAYDPNAAFRSGQTLQAPPEGTVPLGFAAFPYGPGPEEAARAGRELTNPLAPTEADLARGKKVFETVCAVCHGPGGAGDGPIIGRFPNPPSLLAQRAREMPDGRVFHVITRGQGIMPPHALQVVPRDRWRLVLHLRALQGGAPAAVAEAPAPAAKETTP